MDPKPSNKIFIVSTVVLHARGGLRDGLALAFRRESVSETLQGALKSGVVHSSESGATQNLVEVYTSLTFPPLRLPKVSCGRLKTAVSSVAHRLAQNEGKSFDVKKIIQRTTT